MTLATVHTKSNVLDNRNPLLYFFIVIALILLGILIEVSVFLISILGLLALILLLISSNSKESLTIIETGTIKITGDSFVFNQNEIIYFNQVKHIVLSSKDYQGRPLHHRNSITEGSYSSGTDNYIELITKENQEIKKQFLLTSERQMYALSTFLSEFIINDMFKNVSNVKQLTNILPEHFRKMDRSRKYIAELIKNGKLNKTEGLLIMNYSSYEEAQELKKHYL
ncbi:conserved hypothetical protein [Tenacibaculum sp. 190524A05c]|uniref:hypothetical protein n=1 Tax=Tenacibaculum platacis TaxID=3137852 RepID=UPI0031FB2BA6